MITNIMINRRKEQTSDIVINNENWSALMFVNTVNYFIPNNLNPSDKVNRRLLIIFKRLLLMENI